MVSHKDNLSFGWYAVNRDEEVVFLPPTTLLAYFSYLVVFPDVLVLVPVGQVFLKLRRAGAHAVHDLHHDLKDVLVVADDVVERGHHHLRRVAG